MLLYDGQIISKKIILENDLIKFEQLNIDLTEF